MLKGRRQKNNHCLFTGFIFSVKIPMKKVAKRIVKIHLCGKPIIGPPNVVKPIKATDKTAIAYNKLPKKGIFPNLRGAS